MDNSLRSDSSSDDSDDIPPTPAAKSTPIVSVNRRRKSSSSSEVSSERILTTNLNHSIKNTRKDDSSSDESTIDAPRRQVVSVKGEKVSPQQTESSSDEEDNQQGRPLTSINSTLSRRSVHSMSSSSSDDSEHETVKATAPRQNDSSDDSDEENALHVSGKSFPAIVTKKEKPDDDSEYSDSSEDTQTPLKLPMRTEDSDSEEEPPQLALKRSVSAQNDDESSDSDDNDKQQLNKFSARDADTSSDEEDANHVNLVKPAPATDSSSESSDDEETDQKPATSRPRHSDDSSDEETGNPKEQKDSSSSQEELSPTLHANKSLSISNRFQTNPEDESSDDEEESSSKMDVPLINNRKADSSSDESNDSQISDDEEPKAKQPITASMSLSTYNRSQIQAGKHSCEEEESPSTTVGLPSLQVKTCVSSEDFSDDDQPVTKHVPSTSHHRKSQSSDDSNEEDLELNTNLSHSHRIQNESSDEDEHEMKFNPNDLISKTTEQVIQTPINISRNSNHHPVPPQLSEKKGISLLEETFKEGDALNVDENPPLTVEDLGSDDEIWLLQCPKSMDIRALKKQSVNLAAESDIQLEDGPTYKRFSITPERNENSTVNCLLPSQNDGEYKISFLPVRGKLVIQEHIHVPKLKIPKPGVKTPVPFPTGLKVRHPLLGAGYEEHIKEAKLALQENAVLSKKKKDKRKSKSDYGSSPNVSAEDIYRDSMNSSHLSSSLQKNGKKRKRQHENEAHSDLSYNNSSTTDEAVHKKKKRESVDTVVNTHSSNQKPHKKSIKEPIDKISANQDSVNESFSKGHKKSKKKSSSEENMGNSNEASFTNSVAKKHKKSKKETFREENSNSNIEAGLKTIKPSWHTPQINDTSVNALNSEDFSQSKKSKKSKKETSSGLLDPSDIKQEKDESIYLNGTNTEQDASLSKKRKRKEDGLESNSSKHNNSLDFSQAPSKKRKYAF